MEATTVKTKDSDMLDDVVKCSIVVVTTTLINKCGQNRWILPYLEPTEKCPNLNVGRNWHIRAQKVVICGDAAPQSEYASACECGRVQLS